MENKFSMILFLVWMVLAIASFVASFWAPLFFKVLGIVFGSFNLMIIGSWVIAYFQDRAAAKKIAAKLEEAKVEAEEKPKKNKKAKKEE